MNRCFQIKTMTYHLKENYHMLNKNILTNIERIKVCINWG